MAVDRIAEFILYGLNNRIGSPNLNRSYQNNHGNEIIGILERDYSKKIMEIPVFCLNDAIKSIDAYNGNAYKYISFVGSLKNGIERKQVTTVLREFLYYSNPSMEKIINKGATYYGYPGFILDGNYDTLLCFKVKLHVESPNIRITDYICYISPKVFENQDRTVEKTIYKKIIPFCSSYELHNNFPYRRFQHMPHVIYDWEGKHIKVVIDDDINILKKPVLPKIDDFKNDDTVKNIILNNINSIILV